MCEIFSAIGSAILGMSAAGAATGAGVSTAATTAIGAAATAGMAAGLTSTGIGIANSLRASREISNEKSVQENLAKQTNRLNVEKTASQLAENRLSNRTLSSLRIPLDKTAGSTVNTQGNSAFNTGLNIPI